MNTNNPPDGPGLLNAVLRQLAGGVQVRPPGPVYKKLPGLRIRENDPAKPYSPPSEPGPSLYGCGRSADDA